MISFQRAQQDPALHRARAGIFRHSTASVYQMLRSPCRVYSSFMSGWDAVCKMISSVERGHPQNMRQKHFDQSELQQNKLGEWSHYFSGKGAVWSQFVLGWPHKVKLTSSSPADQIELLPLVPRYTRYPLASGKDTLGLYHREEDLTCDDVHTGGQM